MNATEPDCARLRVGALFDGERWRLDVCMQVDAHGVVRSIEPARGSGGHQLDVLVPALVNAHSHLDLGPVAGPGGGTFASWLRSVIEQRRAGPSSDVEALARLEACARSGVLTFGDIDSTGVGFEALARSGLGGRSYAEVLGFDVDEAEAERRIRRASRPDASSVRSGLSPHAPYSTSSALFRAALASGQRLAVHVSETEEEVRFLQHGDGPMGELLQELGKWDPAFVPPRCSPLAWLHSLGCIGPRILLIHLQVLLPGDLDLLAASHSPVVVCPGTIEWFGRCAPAVEAMLARGVTVALGTDSAASNAELDLFREMSLLRRRCPGLLPELILGMATAAGGDALGLDVGRIAIDRPLDAVELREPPRFDPGALSDWITAARPDPWPWHRGKPWDGVRGTL